MDKKIEEAIKICEDAIATAFPHLSWHYPPEGHGPISCAEIKVVPCEYLEKIRDILKRADCSTEF